MSLPPKKPSGPFQKPGVVFQPEAVRGLQKGVNLMVDAIRPTLGPLPRTVAIERIITNQTPELLDSGGTIARRIPQINGRNADMGAMFVRHVLWKIQERMGDGTTTAAVLLQNIFNGGIRYLQAGGNAMRLRHYLERAMVDVLDAIDQQTQPLEGKQRLARFAETVCHDQSLAGVLGEVFDVLGPYGRLEIRTGRGREITREYVQGVYWDEGLLAQSMIDDVKNWRTVLADAAVLVTDLEIKTAEESIHLLEFALREGIKAILLVARSIDDAALAPLMIPRNRELVKVAIVRTPGNFMDVQSYNLMDLAIMTGGRPVLKSAGGSLLSFSLDDFGQARRAWAYRDTFGITTGKGDPRQVRQHIDSLKQAYLAADDLRIRTDLEKRIGRLNGGSANLWIGALNEAEFETKKALAEHTSHALRAALILGVAPGGGTALLAAKAPLLKQLPLAVDEDQRVAIRILLRALEEPFRAILENAGFSSGQIAARLSEAKPGFSYDAYRKTWVDAHQEGLVDAALVLKDAVRTAIANAALLLTTDVLVHVKNPPEQYNT